MIGLVAVILAFSFTWLIRSNVVNSSSDTVRQRLDQVQMSLSNEQSANEALMQQNSDLKAQLDQAAQSNNATKGLADMLAQTQLLAGLTDVAGPGVIVTLNDRSGTGVAGTYTNPNFDLIHDEDILKVMNELRAAGAEALSLNDERILATSQIRCAGPVVTVNNSRYGTPFIIKAIGDPPTMESALEIPGGVQQTLQTFGLTCDITQSDSLTIKAYTGTINNQYITQVTPSPAPADNGGGTQ